MITWPRVAVGALALASFTLAGLVPAVESYALLLGGALLGLLAPQVGRPK